MTFAPTRSGKGLGLVIPTLLTWTESAVVHDIKGENWQLTAGWRARFSHCLLFNPTDLRSARYNPLLEVRDGVRAMSRPVHPERLERRRAMLRTALGPVIAGWLDEPRVVDVLLNPDGSLWVERLGEPRVATGDRLAAADAERIIRLVADHVGAEAHAGAPIVSAELPESGERFEGLLPPVAAAPMFAIRRQAAPYLTLADYVKRVF